MEEDIIGIVLRAENEYQYAINNAVEKAEEYAEGNRGDQSAFLEKQRLDFELFEKEQREHFEKTLRENMHKMNEDNSISKEKLTASFTGKAETVSDRLMKEVLVIHGNS